MSNKAVTITIPMSTTSSSSETGTSSIYFDSLTKTPISSPMASSQDLGFVASPYKHNSAVDQKSLSSYRSSTSSKNPFALEATARSNLDSLGIAEFGATGLSLSTDVSSDHSSEVSQGHSVLENAATWTRGSPLPDKRDFDHQTQLALNGTIVELTFNNEKEPPNGSSLFVGQTAPKNIFTNKEGVPVNSGTFINGAGTVGPHASIEPSDDLARRARDADFSLSQKQKTKIIKAEAKDNQRISKIIKQEARVEKKALDSAIGELANLQRFQKQAVKDEAKAHNTHSKVLGALKKEETIFLASKSRFETLQGQIKAEAVRLEAVRESAKMATERVAEKTQEVDGLRKMFGIDEREREVKLGELKESSLWKV